MKYITLSVFTLLLISLSNAQTAKNSLNAKKIDNEVYLEYKNEEDRYGLTNDKVTQKINLSKSFSSPETSISLFIKSKNPITNELKIENKTVLNDNYRTFKETLNQIIQSLPGFAPAGVSISSDKDFVTQVGVILKHINETNENNFKTKISLIDLGFQSILNYIKTEKNNLNGIATRSANWYDELKAFETDAELVVTLNTYVKILKAWGSQIPLSKFEEKLVDNISRDSVQVLNISVIEKTLKLDAENKKITLENASDESTNVTLNFEKFSRFVPEVAAGIVFTDLSFPRFGTSTNDQNEQIVSAIDDKEFSRINVALMINFNYNIGDSEFVPFFQLGVGPSKKYPILFTGGGVQITDKIKISAGGAWTWINELSSLNIGDVVSGTTAIDDDQRFKFRNKPRLYLSLQYRL